MKNRPMNDVLPQRRSTGETPALAPRPLPTPPAPQRPVVAKGDGMTSDKPALPSEQRPDAGKLARAPSNPGTPAAPIPKAPVLPRRKGGYGKGDGMTAPKPKL